VLNRLDLRGVAAADLAAALPRPAAVADEPVAAVRAILDEVRHGGDAAVRALTERWDGVVNEELRVPAVEIAEALAQIDPPLRRALEEASASIEAFHRAQLRGDHHYSRNGIVVEGRQVPVDRAGLYVPGGRGAYPSSVLMTAVPARVAGVREIVLCVPPDRDTGRVATSTLAAAARELRHTLGVVSAP